MFEKFNEIKMKKHYVKIIFPIVNFSYNYNFFL